MHYSTSLVLLALQYATAFPWVPNVEGVDSSVITAKRTPKSRSVVNEKCPFNPNHPGAVPITKKYPYLGAINGKKGTGKGGIQVPTPGDTAHYFEAPGPLDIRGPCPGLNTAANHHFLSHDGITTYDELVDMQQNLYNVGFDLANLLAIAGVGLDGDLINGKVSIGCEATARTSSTDGLLGTETGLNGHNKFEGDTSLSRDDFFLGDGDDYKFNGTLFGMMADTCKDNFDLDGLALYRYQRYQQSKRDNGNFFFGPGSLLLFGAATFLYELFPSFGPEGTPDLATEMSFFGASKVGNKFVFNNMERIPDNWHNRRMPYDNNDVGGQIIDMYLKHPVEFGGNIGRDNFNALNFSSYITHGKLNKQTPQNVMCLTYELLTAGFPTSLSKVYQIPTDALSTVLGKLAPGFANLGCPGPLFPKEKPALSS